MNGTRLTRISYFLAIIVALSTTAFAQPHDVAWTFGNVGSSSYKLDAFEPGDVGFGTIGEQDPTLPLELGRRYQVKVTNYTVHPFEVIAKAASPSQDQVLLSMSIQGPLESDPEVNWEDDGRGTVAFTLTLSLYEAMTAKELNPGYRCRPHLFTMRGDFAITGLPIAERIGPFPIQIDLETIAAGLTAPVDLLPDPEVSDRLYAVDQAGKVHVIHEGMLQTEPFLDVTDRIVQPLGILGSFDVDDYDERGLLGLAFHPEFGDTDHPGHHKVYTYTSEPVSGPADFTVDLSPDQMNHQSVITEWQMAREGNRVEPATARVLMRIDQPQFNHDGGAIVFGPDGYLYIALGDGGGANDTADGHGDQGNGQNINTVHGSILRIDPVAPELTPDSRDFISSNGSYRIPWDNHFVGIEGIDEIYAYGFRNPYRFSFDKLSGMLIVGDVGQDFVEEINIVRKGLNYGWNIKEGDFLFDPEGQAVGLPFEDKSLIDPVAQYDHEDGLSVIGGYMYYGTQIPELRALYVFGDFSRGFTEPDGRLLVADLLNGQIQELLIGKDSRNLNLFVKGIGQDHDGEVYVLASTALGPYGNTGVVLKIVGLPQD
ncbi:PQQ-dependent sugar dehydrogenase [Planctomycetota bacterium]